MASAELFEISHTGEFLSMSTLSASQSNLCLDFHSKTFINIFESFVANGSHCELLEYQSLPKP